VKRHKAPQILLLAGSGAWDGELSEMRRDGDGPGGDQDLSAESPRRVIPPAGDLVA
jgi:hypothetical protein